MIVASVQSAADPQPSFAKWDAMFSVLPFHIPISGLFKFMRLKSRCFSKTSGPLNDRHIYSIGSRITNNKASQGRFFAYATKSPPNLRLIVEIAGNHQVIGLFATAL